MERDIDSKIKGTMNEMEIPDCVNRKVEDTLSGILAERTGQPEHSYKTKLVRKISWRVAAAFAAAVLAGSGTVYAGVKLYQLHVQKQSNYSAEIHISTDEDPVAGDSNQMKKLNISAGYIPEEFTQDEKYEIGYTNEEKNAGYEISSQMMLIDTDQPFKVFESTAQEEMTVNGRDALYIEQRHSADTDYIDAHLYVLYPEYDSVESFWAWGYASKNELVKIAENVVISETDQVVDVDTVYKWSDYVSAMQNRIAETSSDETGSKTHDSIALSDVQIYKMNEEVPYGMQIDSEDHASDQDLSFSVKSVTFSDNLKEISRTDNLSDYLKENLLKDQESMKLKADILEYMNIGDGEDALTETVKTEEREVELATAEIAVTNHTDQNMEDVWYLFSLYSLQEDGNELIVVNPADGIADTYEYRYSRATYPEMLFYDVEGQEDNNNHIAEIKAGESVTIKVSWFVDTEYKNQLYLTVGETGWFDEDAEEYGLVQIE